MCVLNISRYKNFIPNVVFRNLHFYFRIISTTKVDYLNSRNFSIKIFDNLNDPVYGQEDTINHNLNHRDTFFVEITVLYVGVLYTYHFYF